MSNPEAKLAEVQNQKNSTEKAEFAIQRIYIKDISFEAPNTPEIFQTEWKPEVKLDLNAKVKQLAPDLQEVALKVTATVTIKDKTAFLIEVDQAGIFIIKSFPKEQLHYMLNSFCPNILFPYAREIISETVARGGFPPLYLSPVNFDALYHQEMEKNKANGDETK